MIIKHGRYIFEELQEVQKGMWAFFFHDCDFQVLVGRAGNSPIICFYLGHLWHLCSESTNHKPARQHPHMGRSVSP